MFLTLPSSTRRYEESSRLDTNPSILVVKALRGKAEPGIAYPNPFKGESAKKNSPSPPESTASAQKKYLRFSLSSVGQKAVIIFTTLLPFGKR